MRATNDERMSATRTRDLVKAARKGRGSRRLVGALALGLALAAIFGGLAFAQTLSVTAVNQHAAAFNGASTSDPDFSTTPVLQIQTANSHDVSNCQTASTGTGTFTTGGLNTYLALSVSGSACAVGDFVEQWQWTPATTLVAETAQFYVSSTYTTTGSPVNYSAEISVTVPSGGSNGDTLNIDVDYGAVPAGGIASLTIVAT
jgi:hypothetical protein